MASRAYQPTTSALQAQFLCQGVLLDATSTASQQITILQPTQGMASPLYPPNASFIVTGVGFRGAGANVNALTTFSIGWAAGNTTSTNLLNASITIQGLTTGRYAWVPVAAGAVGLGGQYLTCTFAGTLVANTTILCDVSGYFGQA